MLVALNDVLKEDGKILHVDAEIGLTEFSSKLGRYPIIEKDLLSLVLMNKGKQKLFIQGKGKLTLSVPCGRCLEEVSVVLSLDIEKEVDLGMTEEERIAAFDEDAFIHGYDLDVDEMVYSEILVNWPYQVLCKEDCKGICDTCGANLNHGSCSCEHADLDPRMAQIRDIFSKFKEV